MKRYPWFLNSVEDIIQALKDGHKVYKLSSNESSWFELKDGIICHVYKDGTAYIGATIDFERSATHYIFKENETKGIEVIVGEKYKTKSGRICSILSVSPVRATPYLGYIHSVPDKNYYIPDETVWYNPDGTNNEPTDGMDLVEHIESDDAIIGLTEEESDATR